MPRGMSTVVGWLFEETCDRLFPILHCTIARGRTGTSSRESLAMSQFLFSMLERRFGDAERLISRREMLKATLGGTAALLMSARDGFAFRAHEAKRIVVVGAGFSGLAAAYELISVGYKVTLVEPRGRLGGRVWSLDGLIRDKTVEAGGELIGTNQPMWAAFAKHLNIRFMDVDWGKEHQWPVRLNGKLLPQNEAQKLWEEMREGLAKINDDARKVNADEPWTSADAEALDRRTTAQWLDSLELSQRCRQALTIQLTAINGVLPAWQSYLANLAMIKGGGVEDYWTQTDALHCEGGAMLLADEMADEIGPAHFVIGKSVVGIKTEEKQATVTLSDGRKLEADDVILTAPASTWGRISFDPALPAGLTPQMGSNTKFLAVVKTRFWEKSKLGSRALSDDIFSLAWEDTCGQPEAGGVCLTAYAGGPYADRARELTTEQRNEQYLAALEEVLPGIRQEFVKAKYVNWQNDPWALGSYSFPAPGQVTTLGPVLHAGLGRLHFSGEHCSYAFIGYMEGALQSGVRTAKKIALRDGVINS
jgi:monoamine oxidase